MRATLFAAVLAAGAFAGTSAFAQADHVHHAFCMKTGGGLECAYDSFAQCQAAVKGATQGAMGYEENPLRNWRAGARPYGYRPSARGLRHREVQQRILPHLG